jgi:hypothetical protein
MHNIQSSNQRYILSIKRGLEVSEPCYFRARHYSNRYLFKVAEQLNRYGDDNFTT